MQWNLSPFLINGDYAYKSKSRINTFNCLTWLFFVWLVGCFCFLIIITVLKPDTVHRVKEVKSLHGAIKLILKQCPPTVGGICNQDFQAHTKNNSWITLLIFQQTWQERQTICEASHISVMWSQIFAIKQRTLLSALLIL